MTGLISEVVVVLSVFNILSSIWAYERGKRHAYDRVEAYIQGGRDELKNLEVGVTDD